MVKEAIRAIQAATDRPSESPGTASETDRASLLNEIGLALKGGTLPPGSRLLAGRQDRAGGRETPAGGAEVGDLMAELPFRRAIYVRIVFVPGEVPLFVADGGAEITFGTARIGQIGRGESLPGAEAPAPEPRAAGSGPRNAPAGFDCAAALSRFSSGPELSAGQRAFLDARIAEIQAKLETVGKAMDELGRLRQGDLAALEKCQGEISEAYEQAQDRALEAATMLLVDGPLEIIKARRAAGKEAVDQGIRDTLLARNAILGVGDVAGLDRTAFALFRVKSGLENIYGRAERLQKTLTGAKALYDLSQWSDPDRDDLQKIKDGTLQLAEMFLGDETLGPALKLGRFTGDTALRLLSLYRAAAAASGFFWDIMAQRFAWGPLVDELQRSLETNLQAVRALQARSRDLQNELNCLRTALR